MTGLRSLLSARTSTTSRRALAVPGAIVMALAVLAGPAAAVGTEDPVPDPGATAVPDPAAVPAAPAADPAAPAADPAAAPAADTATTPAPAATEATKKPKKSAKKAKHPKRKKSNSRSLPRAGGPAASQAYARAYIAQRYGWGAGQFSCLKVMWTKESAWKYWVSNPNGIYHGIPQTSRHEWSKDGYTTRQYMRSPAIQIRVGARYIKSRYGTPCAAWAFWRNHHWY